MSSSEIRALRAELEALRLSVEAVRESVQELRERLDLVSGEEEGAPRVGLRGSPTRPSSVSGYSLVSHTPSSAALSTQETHVIETADHEGRAALAKEIGRFLVRCLEGSNRGSSGRSRLKLQSRLYLILADYSGNRVDLRVVRDFATASSICKRGPSCGQSIFVGFATEWEAKLACEEAGIAWPGC